MSIKLALGTVQFGKEYGIANQSGQLRADEVADILEFAWKNNINTLDTAIDYGTAEQCLGDIGVKQWRLMSKLPATPEKCKDVDNWIQSSVHDSLIRLKIEQLDTLLLHHPQQLTGPLGEQIYNGLQKLKDQGLINKTGISIYAPDELDLLWQRFPFDIVQSPFNCIDRRLLDSGWLNKLDNIGCEIHTRSVFLQGLLLMPPEDRPDYFRQWSSLWTQWEEWKHTLEQHSISLSDACLTFVMSQPEISRVIVGVDSLKQIKELVQGIDQPTLLPPVNLACTDIDLLNPSLWNLQ